MLIQSLALYRYTIEDTSLPSVPLHQHGAEGPAIEPPVATTKTVKVGDVVTDTNINNKVF
jgi:hypothetical protein